MLIFLDNDALCNHQTGPKLSQGKRQPEDSILEDAPTCKGLQVLNYQLSNLHLSFFFLSLKETQMPEDMSFKDTSVQCV